MRLTERGEQRKKNEILFKYIESEIDRKRRTEKEE